MFSGNECRKLIHALYAPLTHAKKEVNDYVRTRISIMGQRNRHLEDHLCTLCDHVIQAVWL